MATVRATVDGTVGTPEVQASRAGKGGIIPPVEHRFPPGVSGNPEGRRTAGATIREWFNAMSEYTQAELRRVMSDDLASVAKKAAARAWIDAASNACNAVGTPIAGPELDRICDRTEGKPKQAIDQTVHVPNAVQIITPLSGGAADADDQPG